MAEAKLYGQNKGGMSINGIIKDYYAYAGENISAGDLVEYVNGIAGKTDYGESVDTQLSTDAYTASTISAVQLDDNKIFIAHSYGNSAYLYGMVCTIDGITITIGTDTVISTTANAGGVMATVKLDNNRVFIAHRDYNSAPYLYALVVSINGTTITAGPDTALATQKYSGSTISACLLPNGNVFVAHSYTSSYYLYAIVCTIDGTTITKGTDTSIASEMYDGKVISTQVLPNGNVFIAHSRGSSAYYLRGIVVSINGTAITKGNDTALATTTGTTTKEGYAISTCLLPNGNIFIAHSYGSNYYLYGMIVSINGTTITAGTDTLLSNSLSNIAYDCISATVLSNGKVFIAHSYGRDTANAFAYLYGIVCDVSGTTITAGTDTALISEQYAGFEISSLLLDNGSIFVAHSNTEAFYYLNAQIFGVDEENNIPTNHIIATEYETQVRKVTTGQFDGIAKTSGEGGDDTGHKDIVSIWTMPSYVIYTDNLFAKNWTKVSDTEYVADDGTVLTASGIYDSSHEILNALDENIDTAWMSQYSSKQSNYWIKIKLPKALKISKMKTCVSAQSGLFENAVIQGSNDNSEWVDLYTITSFQSSLRELNLDNVDCYEYYRILITTDWNDGGYYMPAIVEEWQVSEYAVLEYK